MDPERGPSFETRFLARRAPAEAPAAEVVATCRALWAAGCAGSEEEKAGNVSCRLAAGFLVTPTGVPLGRVGAEDLVRVVEVRYDAGTVLVVGRHPPSSETLLHHLVYVRRPDVRAVLHAHSDDLLRLGPSLGIPYTPREAPRGSRELAELAAQAAQTADVFLLFAHGFVALGEDLGEARDRALAALARAR